jgi:hypothetical protein
MRVTNNGVQIARECRPYLLNVMRRAQEGTWEDTEYTDPLQLIWSNKKDRAEATQPVDLPSGIPQYIDLVMADDKHNVLTLQTEISPLLINSIFKSPGTYRLEVQVSGSNCHSSSAFVDVRWDGRWDTLTA